MSILQPTSLLRSVETRSRLHPTWIHQRHRQSQARVSQWHITPLGVESYNLRKGLVKEGRGAGQENITKKGIETAWETGSVFDPRGTHRCNLATRVRVKKWLRPLGNANATRYYHSPSGAGERPRASHLNYTKRLNDYVRRRPPVSCAPAQTRGEETNVEQRRDPPSKEAKGENSGRGDASQDVRGNQSEPHLSRARDGAPNGNKDSGAIRPTLFEELFPDQAKASQQPFRIPNVSKRLPLWELSRLEESRNASLPRRSSTNKQATESEFQPRESVDDGKVTIMVLANANPNLTEVDFRSVARKGWHIGEWRGREDPLQVIPARDEASLLFRNHYYLVFPTPELARAYRSRAEHLHKLAQVHMPTNIASPLLPPLGTTINGEDIGALLREYTLAPPSQPLYLHVLPPPYSLSHQRLLAAKGTVPLVHPVNRAGRSVLFWVDGFSPTTHVVTKMLDSDGQDRGLPWYPIAASGNIEPFDGTPRSPSFPQQDDPDTGGVDQEEARAETGRNTFRRWLISFENETEARRFVRLWHMRPFPMWQFGLKREDGEPLPVVHTEFMW